MEDKKEKNLNGGFSPITHCPACNWRYEPLEARILIDGRQGHLVYIKCRHCLAGYLALVSAGNLGITSLGVISDLNPEEAKKFFNQAPISADEVIGLHENLKSQKVLLDDLKNN